MNITTKQAVIGVILAAVIGAAATYVVVSKQERSGGVMYEPPQAIQEPSTQSPDDQPPQEGVACTMDAKLCPDGSSVGRQGPNCEFAPCPGETSSTEGSAMGKMPAGWITFNGSGFIVSAPAGFEKREEGPLAVAFYKQGPTQREGTEIYDGILIRFELKTLTQPTLSQEVDDQIKMSTEDGISQITSPKTATVLSGFKGYTYVESSLGDFTHFLVQKTPESKSYVYITMLLEDPSNQGFAAQVQEIVDTLQIAE